MKIQMNSDTARATWGHSRGALDHELERQRREFARLTAERTVDGDWEDSQWSYGGRYILFGTLRSAKGDIVSNRNKWRRMPLRACSADLARCVVVHCIRNGMSGATVLSYLSAVRYLDDVIGSDLEAWAGMTKRQINAALDVARKASNSDFTIYNRASYISCVIRYLNSIQRVRGRSRSQFLPTKIHWHHGLPNPTKSWLEQSGATEGYGTKRRVPEGLEKAIGELRAAVRLHPKAEPKPGFDSLRLGGLAFALGMGLRVNEITTLPVNCLDVEQQTGSPFLRVWTEKGQLPVARPVPLIWNPIYVEVLADVVKNTEAARRRAREIEERGFAFVFDDIARYRADHPFTAIDAFVLSVLGHDTRRVAWPRELEEVFHEGHQRFWGPSKRYSKATFFLPPMRQCCLVMWLDNRIESWDWNLKRFAHYRKSNHPLSNWLKLAEVAEDMSVSLLSIKRAVASEKGFLAFIKYLEGKGIRPGIAPPAGAHGRKVRMQVIRRWKRIRHALLADAKSHESRESRRTLVALDRWVPLLEKQYSGTLRRHYEMQDVSHYIGPHGLKRRGRLQGASFQPLSEHLFVVWENSFERTKQEGILPQPLTEQDLYHYLSTKSDKENAFARFGILDTTGTPYSVSPHQIRHWLTTALLRSGPNQMIVDLWMGRTPGQSRIYDHRTPRERAEAARQRYLAPAPPADYFGKLVTQWRIQKVSEVEIAAMLSARFQILHFTLWGACTRELTVMPCQKALACVRGFGSSRGCHHFSVNYDDVEAKGHLEAKLVEYQGLLLALEPRYPNLKKKFASELNSTEPLDQHLMFLHEMVEGIRAVLHEYKVHAERAERDT